MDGWLVFLAQAVAVGRWQVGGVAGQPKLHLPGYLAGGARGSQ